MGNVITQNDERTRTLDREQYAMRLLRIWFPFLETEMGRPADVETVNQLIELYRELKG